MRNIPRKIGSTAVFLILLLAGLSFAKAEEAAYFKDMTGSPLYDPWIEHFARQGFAGGYHRNGRPTGFFGPHNEILRSEMAKLGAAVRLAEERGIQEKWHALGELALGNAVSKALEPYRTCRNGVCEKIGGEPFPDVALRAGDCFENPGAAHCQPWFTEFVYFAVDRGYLQGYLEGLERRFRPERPAARIHALKIVIADNGHVSPEQDLRFLRLAALARQKGFARPLCLIGAEERILQNNAGDHRLLAYATLADRLRLFGESCELFVQAGRITPEQRADFLQQNVTRKEAVRWLGMTTTYAPLYDLSFVPQSTEPPAQEEWTKKTLEELAEEAAEVKKGLLDEAEEGEVAEAPFEEELTEIEKEIQEIVEEGMQKQLEKPDGQGEEDGNDKAQDPYLSQLKDLEDWFAKTPLDERDVANKLWQEAQGRPVYVSEKLTGTDPAGQKLSIPSGKALRVIDEEHGPQGDYAWVAVEGYSQPYKVKCSLGLCSGNLVAASEGMPLLGIDFGDAFSGTLKITTGLGIMGRLESRLNEGYTITQTRNWGLTQFRDVKGSREAVEFWAGLKLERYNKINANLNSYLAETGDMEGSLPYGLGKGKPEEKKEGTAEHRWVNQWYAAAKALYDEKWPRLDKELLKPSSALAQVRDWGLAGKKEGATEHAVVTGWYNKKKKADPIDRTYQAKGMGAQYAPSSYWSEDEGMRRGQYKATEIQRPFKIIKESSFSSYESDPKRNTYVVAHGWSPGKNEDAGSWTKGMVQSILAADPNAQILRIDWTPIANQPTPGQATQWLSSITDIASEALKKWGVNQEKTFVVGNSLGSLLAQELSLKLGGANVIGLDPAYYPVPYEVDFKGKDFGGFGGNATCLVADASWSGSEALMRTCREGYLVDYSGTPDFTLFTELYEYVDFVIDETLADSKEYVIDKGITYALDKATKASGKTIPGVKMYRIANGQLKEVAVEELKEYACKPVNAVARLPYVCEYGLDKLKQHFVTYHLNVPKSYAALLKYPFYKNLLSPGDLASRKNSGPLFPQVTEESLWGLVSKQYHGIIYTEKEQPERIKYLKVRTFSSPERITLYGNTQNNQIECLKKEEKECIVYTGEGDDKILEGTGYFHLAIKDFMRNNNKDQLLVSPGASNLHLDDIQAEETLKDGEKGVKLSLLYATPFGKEKFHEVREVFLAGVFLEEVNGWLKSAKNDDGTLTNNQLKKLPILIQ